MLEQVKLVSLIIHIIYMGIEYSHVHHGHNGIENCLTQECALDCLIACHTVVYHKMIMKDFLYLIYPWLLIVQDQIVVRILFNWGNK